MGTGSLSRDVRWPERGVGHPLTSIVDVREGVEIYLYVPLGFRGLL